MVPANQTRFLKRDRVIALATLFALAALAWVYLWITARHMGSMSGAAGAMNGAAMAGIAMTQPWSAESLVLTFLMWSIMMIGMMLPSAAPAILLYGSMVRANRARGAELPSVWIFTAGYFAIWTAFGFGATALQAALDSGGLLTPMMASKSAWLSGGLLIAAGLYQWLPIKDACLKKCRAPLQFFLARWRGGATGAFRMGAEHGFFCVGCCWALMLLLFAAGVMNLLWVAVIAGFVLIEKLVPAGRAAGRVAGIGLAAAGATMIVPL